MTIWKSQENPQFRSQFSEDIFRAKYQHEGCETWDKLSYQVALDVVYNGLRDQCGHIYAMAITKDVSHVIASMKFIPGGRYLYYAGRNNRFFNNCYLLKCEEDTREDWANLSWKAESCLMTGGGIGADYTIYRPAGAPIARTGGVASGPIPKMEMINEIGRRVMQGGSRRSAIYASLAWDHADIGTFLRAKNWDEQPLADTGLTHWGMKQRDFNWHAPLDMTNISVNYDTEWLDRWRGGYAMSAKSQEGDKVFYENCLQACRTGEPGFSFNFGVNEGETLRNACTEVTSRDDSDVCNLGSINLSRIESLDDLRTTVELATIFLLCGTIVADVPYEKIKRVREKNRRLGLGLMGVHEWLLKRGYRYEQNDELGQWLDTYRRVSGSTGAAWARRLGISEPVAFRAIAPTGTIGILAGTTTGIEPIFATAYKRRYLRGQSDWRWQYVCDGTAETVARETGRNPRDFESALGLSSDRGQDLCGSGAGEGTEPTSSGPPGPSGIASGIERRISFQAFVQDYVDMAISSTINLPPWGSELNNEDTVSDFADVLSRYCHRLRGLTCYPDGSRGGQPLTPVDWDEAKANEGVEFMEHDICDISGKGGSCGV